MIGRFHNKIQVKWVKSVNKSKNSLNKFGHVTQVFRGTLNSNITDISQFNADEILNASKVIDCTSGNKYVYVPC